MSLIRLAVIGVYAFRRLIDRDKDPKTVN